MRRSHSSETSNEEGKGRSHALDISRVPHCGLSLHDTRVYLVAGLGGKNSVFPFLHLWTLRLEKFSDDSKATSLYTEKDI